jgi:rhodanese-related sulfurtransferase
MDGDMLSFQYKRETGDFQFTANYQGKVSEDTIKGTIEFSSDRGSREFDWEAKRSTELADVLGKWKFKIETDDGNVLEPSIRFTKEGDKVQGAYVGLRDTQREATNIKVADNKLTFEISGENNGNPFKVVYMGKPRGDSIKGTIDYDFNGNTGTVDFEGKRLPEKEKNGEAKPAEKVTAKEHTTDSLKTVQQRLVDNTAVLVDVREQNEWDQGHLEAAVLVPLSKLKEDSDSKDFVEQLAQILLPDKIIYCHCRSGGRVLVATPILQKMGYDVRPLKAGYADLLKAGFSTGNQQLTDKLD